MPKTTDPTRSAMWAMAHPVRYRIFELLYEGPSTSSRLARRLGESRGLVSYHVRMLARAGLVHEDTKLGTRRERWWRRPAEALVLPTHADVEGRAIADRFRALLYAREQDVRHRLMTRQVSDDWQRAAYFGNWVIELTPDEADDLGQRLFALVDELRRRPSASSGSDRALVSLSVLPVLDEDVSSSP